MTEELKNLEPPIEAKVGKSPEALLAESKDRTAIYEGSGVAQKGHESLSYFAGNPSVWEDIEPQTEDNETEHARHTWSLKEKKVLLDSGGTMLIKKGHIRHQALLPDDYGYKVPEMVYDFEGTGFSAKFAFDTEGNPTRTIVYEMPSDAKKPRRIELFTHEGSLEAQSGTPEFDTLEKELAIEVGKGLRPAPKELSDEEAGDEVAFRSTLEDINSLPETPEQS